LRPASTLAASALLGIALAACDSKHDAAPASEASAPSAAAATPDDGAPANAWFSDVTAEWGLDFTHDAGLTPEKHLPETMGAGAALADFDADGDVDVYLVQGGPMRLPGEEPGQFRDPPGPLPTNQLFGNDGRGKMTNVTAASGAAAHTGYGMAAIAGDVDADGHLDLYLTHLGPGALLGGDGRMHFVDRTAESGLADPRWSSAAIFVDAEGDGDLDLYSCAYVEVDLAHPVWCGGREPGWRSACHPDAYAGLLDKLWINDGRGVFRDGTEEAGMAASAGKALGVVAADFDEDGDVDVYTANDSVEHRFWENLGGGKFRDATLLTGTGVDERGLTEAGMGVAVGDVDGDLDIDIFATSFDDESDTLYVNGGDGTFRDRTVSAGLEGPTRMPVAFGCVLDDFDHDGNLDLAVANGHIIDNIQLFHDGKTHAQASDLYRGDGRGRFQHLDAAQAGALANPARVARGLYSADLDGDGDLDLLLTQCGGKAALLRNDAARTPGLQIGGAPAGSTLTVTLQDGRRVVRVTGTNTSYFGQGQEAAHFGVDPASVTALSFRAPYQSALEFTRAAGSLPETLGPYLKLVLAGGAWCVR
jgi:enediyne biosynthesis protein E4